MISARPPNAAAGSPPPMTLPKVVRSPAMPSRPYQPDLVTRKPVRTSSMTSRAPYSPHSAASSSLKPAAGGTIPMFAGHASVITQAISVPLAANAWRVRQPERGDARAGGHEQRVDVPVVAAGELHHQTPSGKSPGQTDRGHR